MHVDSWLPKYEQHINRPGAAIIRRMLEERLPNPGDEVWRSELGIPTKDAPIFAAVVADDPRFAYQRVGRHGAKVRRLDSRAAVWNADLRRFARNNPGRIDYWLGVLDARTAAIGDRVTVRTLLRVHSAGGDGPFASDRSFLKAACCSTARYEYISDAANGSRVERRGHHRKSDTLDDYAEVLLSFREWCAERQMNFRAEVLRLVKARMEA